MAADALNFDGLVAAIRQADAALAEQASRAVNVSLTLRNWFIGYHIAEFELQGADRASYGDKLLAELSRALREQSVSNTGRRQLYGYLARSYPARCWKKKCGQCPHNSRMRQHWILLCTRKNHELVEYALAGMSNKLFVSRYQVQLPGKEEMAAFLHKAVEELEGGDE